MEFDKASETSFLEALAQDKQDDISRMLPEQEFILLEVEDEDESDDPSDDSDVQRVTAMIAEVEDFSALIVFTSPDMVDVFAAQTDLFDGVDGIPSFIMSGRELMAMLPEDTGLLFNPESDECFVMSPAVFQSFREDLPEDE